MIQPLTGRLATSWPLASLFAAQRPLIKPSPFWLTNGSNEASGSISRNETPRKNNNNITGWIAIQNHCDRPSPSSLQAPFSLLIAPRPSKYILVHMQ